MVAESNRQRENGIKIAIVMAFLTAVIFCTDRAMPASDPSVYGSSCRQDIAELQGSRDRCSQPDVVATSPVPGNSIVLLLSMQDSPTLQTSGHESQTKNAGNKAIVYFFWGRGCPRCEEQKAFFQTLKRDLPSLEIRDFEVWYNRENAALMETMLRRLGMSSSGVPLTFVHDRVFSGFNREIGVSMGKTIRECAIMKCADPSSGLDESGVPGTKAKTEKTESDISILIPFMGNIETRNTPMLALTLVIAGMDSFNPCAFFVLLSLLGLLIHARSRRKMLLIGGIFVFFSALIYFIFMAAWLNLFLVMGHVAFITTVAGTVSLVIAFINIKEFFLFGQGISLTIPDSAKPKLFDRMRKLLRSNSLVSIMIGTTVLAIVANFYELLCTAGFPMLFTRILTLNNLSSTSYYLYLALYNIVYVIPMFIIVLGFTFTLGGRKLSEQQGRIMKLTSGLMMLGLGGILLINPALLNSIAVSSSILLSALGISLLAAMVTRRPGK